MRKLFLSLSPFLLFPVFLAAQCTGGSLFTTISPALGWQTSSGGTAGQYHQFTATQGTSYQFSYCAVNGGSVSYDSQLTILDNNGNPLAYNDDACGLFSDLLWMAPASGIYRVYTTQYFCSANNIQGTLAYRSLPPNPLDSICAAQVIVVDASPALADNMGASPGALPPASCWSDGTASNDIWFSFVAPSSGNVAIETYYVNNITTQLALYASSNNVCTGTLTEIGCNEFGGNNALIVAMGLNPGQTYFVRVDGYLGDIGSFMIEVRTANPPVNDSICSATALIIDAPPLSADNTYASADGLTTPSCFTDSGIDGDTWFSFVAPPGGAVAVETSYNGGLFDSQLALYASSNNVCTGTLTEIGCNEFGNLMSQLVATNLVPGNTYFIRMDGYFSSTGTFNIQVRTVVPPANDAICNAMPLIVDAFPASVTNEFALPDSIPLPGCFSDGMLEHSVWFRFVAPSGGAVEVETFYNGGLQNSQLALYAAAPNNCNGTLTEIGCNESGQNLSLIAIGGLTPGETYFVMMDGYFGGMGTFSIQVRTPLPLCILNTPPGAQAENETCGNSSNYGCSGIPYQFTQLSCNAVFTGTIYNDIFPEDEDWYRFSVFSGDTVKIKAQAQFNMNFRIYNVASCNNPFVLYQAAVNACDSVLYTGFLPQGSYAVRITAQPNEFISCIYRNAYWLSYKIGASVHPVHINDPGVICVNDPAFNFSVMPSVTGIWSGTGITGSSAGTFSPSVAGQGIHNIHFATTSNSNGCQARDSVQVMVNGLPQSSFMLTQNGLMVSITDQSVNLSSYSWNFGDGTFSTLQSPTHIYAQPGIYNVVLIGSNPCGVSLFQQVVSLYALGTEAIMAPVLLSVFPNPTDGLFQAELSLSELQDIEMHLTDITGRVVAYRNISQAAGILNEWLDIRYETSGVYILTISGNFGSLHTRLVKL